MSLEYIKPKELDVERAAGLSYGYAVRSGNLLFISGQVARDHHGQMVGIGDPEAQAVQVFENLKAVLAAAGGTLQDVIVTRTYVTDRAHLPKIIEVRKRYLTGPNFPTSAAVIGSGLTSPEYLIEMEAVAHLE